MKQYLKEHLAAVCSYLQEEEGNYYECFTGDVPPDDHIWLSVEALLQWLDESE